MKCHIIPIIAYILAACSTRDLPDNRSKTARIAMIEDATTLDGRKARSLNTANVIQLIYEGLTREDKNGAIVPAVAGTIDVSDDQKTYTFHLKTCQWSNGDPVTAHDFEYAIKSTLDPKTGSPIAYQLFVIKNAKNVFEGKAPLSSVGITALNEKTLQIILEEPCVYFTKLLSFYPFFPLPKKWIEANPQGSIGDVSNGPFIVESWQPSVELTLKKNPFYHDVKNVHLEKITLPTLDATTSINIFEMHGLDWTGSPLSMIPPDAIQSLKKGGKLQTAPAAATQFIRINCVSAFFANKKMRKAFFFAIDRQGIAEHIMQGNEKPALTLVPPCLLPLKPTIQEQNPRTLFNEAIIDIGTTQIPLTSPSMIYVANERNQKITGALQQQFKENLGVEINLIPLESKMFYSYLKSKNYDLALGSWVADFLDPINFLSVFEEKDNGTNNTEWENSEYQKLLKISFQETNPEKRDAIFREAEKILAEDVPIIPLFYLNYLYLKNEKLQNAYVSPLGILDLKHAEVIE